MSVSGLCQLCEDAQAVDTCSQCGAAVCEFHYSKPEGLCADCAEEHPGPATREQEERHSREGTQR